MCAKRAEGFPTQGRKSLSFFPEKLPGVIRRYFPEVIEMAGLKGGVLAVIPAKSCSHGSSASCPGEASLAKPKDFAHAPKCSPICSIRGHLSALRGGS